MAGTSWTGISSVPVPAQHQTSNKSPELPFSQGQLAAFRATVLEQGGLLYRDLPWRETRDPYAIWISEVMLQQTQVLRVDGRWQRWLERFPNVAILARAPQADVLEEWQGLGYNRRALSVQKAAQALVGEGGAFPSDARALCALPGIGPATAAGVRAFAFNLHSVYLETNVRTVLLHQLFPGQAGITDKQLIPLVDATCPQDARDPKDDPRTWYYALLDYGAYLKRTQPNPSRRSAAHTRQSKFEGSHRQKRAALVRLLLANRQGVTAAQAARDLSAQEAAAGRPAVTQDSAAALLAELEKEGFCHKTQSPTGEFWAV